MYSNNGIIDKSIINNRLFKWTKSSIKETIPVISSGLLFKKEHPRFSKMYASVLFELKSNTDDVTLLSPEQI